DAEPLDAAVELPTHGAQLLPNADLLGEEALHFGLLLGAHQQRARVVAGGLQLGEVALRLGELRLEPLLGLPEARVRLAAQLLHLGERPGVRRTAAKPDQLRAARE